MSCKINIEATSVQSGIYLNLNLMLSCSELTVILYIENHGQIYCPKLDLDILVKQLRLNQETLLSYMFISYERRYKFVYRTFLVTVQPRNHRYLCLNNLKLDYNEFILAIMKQTDFK